MLTSPKSFKLVAFNHYSAWWTERECRLSLTDFLTDIFICGCDNNTMKTVEHKQSQQLFVLIVLAGSYRRYYSF